MAGKIYILYKARFVDCAPVGKFISLELLKKECVEHYGFPETIHKDEDEFKAWLEGTEMKYEKI